MIKLESFLAEVENGETYKCPKCKYIADYGEPNISPDFKTKRGRLVKALVPIKRDALSRDIIYVLCPNCESKMEKV